MRKMIAAGLGVVLALFLVGGAQASSDQPQPRNTGNEVPSPANAVEPEQDPALLPPSIAAPEAAPDSVAAPEAALTPESAEMRASAAPCGLSGYYTDASAPGLFFNYTIRQCNGYTVRRKVVVNNAPDSSCRTIGAYSQVTGSVYVPPGARIEGIRSC